MFGKLTEITLIFQETKIDILGITETHFSDKIKDEEIRIDGYNVQRLDRSNQQGGGCLMYYREGLDHGCMDPQATMLRCYTKTKVGSKISGSYLD